MKHILFPTASAADAFLADMQGRGATMGSSTYARRSALTDTTAAVDAGAGAEDAGAGAVKGTGVGAAVGAAAGFLGTAGAIAAGVATGGLAVPVILGFAALGSGVGAAVGATGGAMGIDENKDGRTADADGYYAADDSYYDRMDATVSGGGRVVAVQDPVPGDVMDAAARHGGEVMDATGVSRMDAGMGSMSGDRSAPVDAAHAAGNKVEEGMDHLRAAGHEVAGAVTGNPKHDALAAQDRMNAERNNAQADADYAEAKRETRDGDGR